eukprot:2086236-Prymnesium_polylepis.1
MEIALHNTSLAAVPACGADIFNSGFMVLTPSLHVAQTLHRYLFQYNIQPGQTVENHTFGFACTGTIRGDQFFLNGWFKDRWTKLPAWWNQHYKFANGPVKVKADENVHFTGMQKPPLH